DVVHHHADRGGAPQSAERELAGDGLEDGLPAPRPQQEDHRGAEGRRDPQQRIRIREAASYRTGRDSMQRPIDEGGAENRPERGAPARTQFLLGAGELHQIDELVNERARRRSSTLLERATNLGGTLDRALTLVQELLNRNELGGGLRSRMPRLERTHGGEARVQNVLELLTARRGRAAWRSLASRRSGSRWCRCLPGRRRNALDFRRKGAGPNRAALLPQLLLVMCARIGRDEHDVLPFVVVEKLGDGDDQIFLALFAGRAVPRESLHRLLDTGVLLGAPVAHRPNEELEIFDRANHRALDLGLPRRDSLDDARCDALDAGGKTRQLAGLRHRRAAAKSPG